MMETIYILVGMPLALVASFVGSPYVALGAFTAFYLALLFSKHTVPRLTHSQAAHDLGKKIGSAVRGLNMDGK